MNLAIIGVGESSRIKAESLTTPKHLIKLDNEYLIERIIRIARENGAQKVICINSEISISFDHKTKMVEKCKHVKTKK